VSERSERTVRALSERSERTVSAVSERSERQQWVVDAPLAAVALLGLLAMVEVVVRGRSADASGTELAAPLLLAVGATAPLAVARAHPVTAALLVAAANALLVAGGDPLPVAAGAAQVVTAYLVGRHSSRRTAILVGLPPVVYAVAPATGDAADKTPILVLFAFVMAAVAVGHARQVRSTTAAQVAEQQAIAHTLLEHAARGERVRIARELHDVVAHHISMIAVQAETARLTTPGMPSAGAKRLVAIADTARTALTEMRRLLGLLREDADTEVTRRPQPGLAQLTEVVDEAREASGSTTRLIVGGRVAPLDPGVELTAFRIVQEALTNVRRHAPGAAVDVEMFYGENGLRLRVRDNGPGPGPDEPTGHGLVGMRERAAMVGGTLCTGPAPGSGFQVTADLPTVRAEL
jgi:signal transduction histidine kinase